MPADCIGRLQEVPVERPALLDERALVGDFVRPGSGAGEPDQRELAALVDMRCGGIKAALQRARGAVAVRGTQAVCEPDAAGPAVRVFVFLRIFCLKEEVRRAGRKERFLAGVQIDPEHRLIFLSRCNITICGNIIRHLIVVVFVDILYIL